MGRTEWGIDKRYAKTSADAAIGTDIIAGVIELISNSDDSYCRLSEQNYSSEGLILLKYRPRHIELSEIGIIDYAEGMTKERIEEILILGKKTSGSENHKDVRGIMGRGLKEAIISLCHEARIFSLKYDSKQSKEMLTIYVLYPETQEKELKLHQEATPDLIKKFKMAGGEKTMIILSLKKEVNCPSAVNLKYGLENHYLLRKIMMDSGRKIILEDVNKKKKYNLKRAEIAGRLWKDEKDRKIPGYQYKYDIKINLSEEPLTQRGPQRDGGILIASGRTVYDCTLCGFEEEATRTIFGEIDCSAIKEMLDKDEMVVKPDRSGLNDLKPFIKVLKEDIREFIKPLVAQLRNNQKSIHGENISEKERQKINSFIRKLNELTEKIAKGEDADLSPGDKFASNRIPINGIEFTSNYYPRDIGHDFILNVIVDSPKRISTYEKITFSTNKNSLILKENMILVGNGEQISSNTDVGEYNLFKVGVIARGDIEDIIEITASVKDTLGQLLTTKAIVRINRPEEFNINDIIEFEKQDYYIQCGREESILLFIDTTRIDSKLPLEMKLKPHQLKDGDITYFELITPKISIGISTEKIIKKKVIIEGKKIGVECLVEASIGKESGFTHVKVVSIPPGEKGPGLVRDVIFIPDAAERRRLFENGIITIFKSAPIVKDYIRKYGEDSKEYNILIAELITQTWAEEVGKYRILKGISRRSISPNKTESIELETHQLERDYSHKIHEWWISNP